MKTLTLNSYIRSAYIWLEQLNGNISRKDKIIRDRIEKKIKEIKENLGISQKYHLDSEIVKQCVEREHNKRGYWTFKHGIHEGESPSVITK